MADTEQAIVTVNGYKGSEANNVIIKKVNNVAASLSDTPTGITGLTFQCSSITSAASPTITFTATTSMISPSGSVPIEIDLTADGVTTTFTKFFNYAISFMGVDGAEPQYVIVSGEQAFKYLGGVDTPVSSPIVLTATLYGGLTVYDWEYWDGDSWEDLSGTQDGQTYSLAYNNTEWGTNTTLRIRCVSEGISDEITIVKLYDGLDGLDGINGTNGMDGFSAITSSVDNGAHSIPASSSGETTSASYVGSGTNIQVFEGNTALTFHTSLAASRFTIGTPTTSGTITVGARTGSGTTTAVVGDHSAMDDSIDVVTITYPITARRSSGEDVAFNVTQTITKAKSGVDGSDPQYVIITGDKVFKYLAGESTPVSSPIVLTAT